MRHIAHCDLKPENVLLASPDPFPQVCLLTLALSDAWFHTKHVIAEIGFCPSPCCRYDVPNILQVVIEQDRRLDEVLNEQDVENVHFNDVSLFYYY